ncbi:unnamed protein product, partial [Scytosiphon promiscuus]
MLPSSNGSSGHSGQKFSHCMHGRRRSRSAGLESLDRCGKIEGLLGALRRVRRYEQTDALRLQSSIEQRKYQVHFFSRLVVDAQRFSSTFYRDGFLQRCKDTKRCTTLYCCTWVTASTGVFWHRGAMFMFFPSPVPGQRGGGA